MVHVTCSAVFSQLNFAYCNIFLCGFQTLVMLQSVLYFLLLVLKEKCKVNNRSLGQLRVLPNHNGHTIKTLS